MTFDLTRLNGELTESATIISDTGVQYVGSVPTIPANDNSLKFATTAFVNTAAAAAVSNRAGTAGSSAKRNNLINGGALVAIQTAIPTLSTTAQYGPVEMVAGWASGGTVGSGTLIQDTAAPVGRTGYAVKFAGVTLSGAGVLSWRYRMAAEDAVRLKNTTQTFQIAVQHDVGSALNYTVIFSKPTAPSVFTSTAAIGTSSPVSVPSATGTTLIVTQALGDCSNGLNIEVQVACGAVTTNNFWFTEWQLEEGTQATPLERRDYQTELAACQRYALMIPIGMIYGHGYTPAVGAAIGGISLDYPVEMRVAPSVPAITFALTQANTPVIMFNTTRGLRISVTGTTSGGEVIVSNSAPFLVTARL